MDLSSSNLDLKEVFTKDFRGLDETTLKMIESVLFDLKINNEDEIVIKGSYYHFGCLFNLLLKGVEL